MKRPIRLNKMTKRQKAAILLETTPGVVSDDTFLFFGVSKNAVNDCGVPVQRVGGLGYRRVGA